VGGRQGGECGQSLLKIKNLLNTFPEINHKVKRTTALMSEKKIWKSNYSAAKFGNQNYSEACNFFQL
jgi:hypothetical protein